MAFPRGASRLLSLILVVGVVGWASPTDAALRFLSGIETPQKHCTCSTDSNCGTSSPAGSCTNGLCINGTTDTRYNCVVNGDCAAANTCDASNADSFEFEEVTGGSAEVQDASMQTTIVHNAASGGSSTSQWAPRFTAATNGEQIYWQPCQTTGSTDPVCDTTPIPFNAQRLTVHAALHRPSNPTGVARAILETRTMTDVASCQVFLDTDGSLILKHNGALITDSGLVPAQYACQDEDTERHIPCTADADCPLGNCSDPATTGVTPNGSFPYFAKLELIHENTNPTETCTLYVDGRRVATGATLIAGGAQNAKTFRFGAVGTEAGTLDVVIDDVWATDTARAGWGYVATAFPASDGVITWTRSGSGSGCSSTTNYLCLQEFADSPFTYVDTPFVSTNVKNRVEQFKSFTPIPTLGTTLTSGGVEVVLIGDGTSDGADDDKRKLIVALLSCPGGTCASNVFSSATLSIQEAANDRVLTRLGTSDSPASQILGWPQGELTGMGMQFQTASTHIGGFSVRVMEALAYLMVERPDSGLPTTSVGDHNKGTDDGIRTIACIGASTAGGTGVFQCSGGSQAGAPCSGQPDYCSWDQPDEKDKPPGGCGGDHSICRSCDGRRTENGGAGYQCNLDGGGTAGVCDSDLDLCCSHATNTCSGGFCVRNPAVPCTTTDDCDDLGSCDSTATCVESCPDGGSCPLGGGGWPDRVPDYVGADVIYKCYRGGRTSTQMVGTHTPFHDNIFGPTLDGTNFDPLTAGWKCETHVGQMRCSCSPDGSNTTHCGTDGVCTAGVCTAGDSVRMACTPNTCVFGICTRTGTSCSTMADCAEPDCASGRRCQYPKPDVVVVNMGTNDSGDMIPSPNCTSPMLVGYPALAHQITSDAHTCACADRTLCTQDSDCASVGTGSICAGFVVSFTDSPGPDEQRSFPCLQNHGFGCTTYRPLCRDDIDCRFCSISKTPCSGRESMFYGDALGVGDCPDGETCSIQGTCSLSDGTACQTNGVCSPTPGNYCPTGWSVSNGMCRKTCATDGQCMPSNPISGVCSGGLCKGQCTCPTDARACTTSADCLVAIAGSGGAFERVTIDGTTRPRMVQGECVGGKCTCSGFTADEGDATCATQYARDFYPFNDGHLEAHYAFRAADAQIAALGDGTPPVLVLGTETERYDRSFIIYGGGCNEHGMYLRKNRQHLLSEFPYVADTFEAFARDPRDRWPHLFVDQVHYTIAGAEIVGHTIGKYLGAWGTCAINAQRCTGRRADSGTAGYVCTDLDGAGDCDAGDLCCNAAANTCDTGKPLGSYAGSCVRNPGVGCTTTADCDALGTCAADGGPLQEAQRFCRNANNSWSTTTCTEATALTACTSAQRCEVKACTTEDENTTTGCPGASVCLDPL